MKYLEFRSAAHEWIEASKRGSAKFPVEAGSNYLVDHRDGSVYEFSVWANVFSIAFDTHAIPGDDDYEAIYRHAVEGQWANTLHYPRD